MKKFIILALGIFVSLFSACGLFNELLEPSDIVKLLQDKKGDGTPPTVIIISPTNGQMVGSNYQISGTVIDSGGSGVKAVYVKTDDAVFSISALFISNWTANITLDTRGLHTHYIYAEDNVGNISEVITLIVKMTNILIDKFFAYDGMAGDCFGCSLKVSADGNTIVAGAYVGDGIVADTGSVYCFHWNGTNWMTNKFVAYDGAAGDCFGVSVALSADGNTIVTGAHVNNSYGSVYRFQWNGFVWETNKITAYDGVTNVYFGYCVAVSADGNTIAVGDFGYENAKGSVYRFQLNGTNWETTKFVPLDVVDGDQFGASVAVSDDGNTIAVGANLDDDNGNGSGSVYRFQLNGTNWETTKFVPLDGAAGDNLGFSVTISPDGNTVISGANHDDVTKGSLYCFHWNGSVWETTKFLAYDGAADDSFGHSGAVSSDGNTIIAGAYFDDVKGDSSGSIYRFKWNGSAWETNKIVAYDGAAGDCFGVSVAVTPDGNTVFAGAFGDADEGVNTGSFYRFTW